MVSPSNVPVCPSIHLPCLCDSVTGYRDIFGNISQERGQQGTTLWSLTTVPGIPKSHQGKEGVDRDVGLGYKWTVEAGAGAWFSLASQGVLLDPGRDASLTPKLFYSVGTGSERLSSAQKGMRELGASQTSA